MPPKSKVGATKKVCCSAMCNEPASQKEMIACGDCKKWWHKECGVTSAEVNELNEPWQCASCKPPPKPMSSATSSSSRRARIDLKLKQLEESRALKEKELAFEREFLEEKQRLMEEQLDAEEEEGMLGDEIPRSRAGDRVESWLKDNELPKPEKKAISDEITRMRQQLTLPEQKPLFEPTKAQLAARHALPKDLPTFNGDPKDWTLFIANYNYSTEACGYQDYENLIRLQRSLKGVALESVRSRLLLPNSVPKVIETLTKRFGRPELVIDTLLEKIASLPPPRGDKLESMIEFGTAVQALSDHIVAVGMLDHLHNPTLIKSLIVKLPAEYKMKWAEYNRHNSKSNLQTFAQYMEEIVDDASSVTFQSMAKEKSTKGQPHSVLVHTNTNQHTIKACVVCKQDGHKIEQCTQFKAMNANERWQTIKSLKLCRTCLNMHKSPCNRTQTCGVDNCTARHHQLLHYKHVESGTNKEEASAPVTIAYHNQEENGFLKMICVTLYNGDKELEILAFIDEGSSLTLLEEEVANSLGLQGRVKPLCLKWTANVTREERNSKQVSFKVSGRGQNRQYPMDGVRTVESLDLPEQSMEAQDLRERHNYLRNIPLCSYRGEKPKMLIGIDNISLIVPQKVREGSSGHPTAVKTRLGWCLYGGKQTISNGCHYHTCDCNDDQSMDNTLKKYFAMEEVAIKSTTPITSAEDQRALEILENTTKYIGNRYESGLLWKYDEVNLPDSYQTAFKRLECFERKLNRTEQLKERVEAQIQEYIQKGYAHIAIDEELQTVKPNRIWYLPLGVVVNPKKPEKARLIWDASSKVNDISLNSVLLKGPDQLCTLPTVLFRFRQYPVAVSADIKEMFHQIRIIEADKQSQRFLWRSDPEKRPDTYIMDVATFGATCSPATAQYIKNHNALRFTQEYPRAVEAIIQNHYVDDYLDSFETQPEAILIAKQVTAIHQKGGFIIRGWCSNVKSVVESLGEKVATNSKEIKTHDFENHAEKVLGLKWDTQQDEFYFPTTMTNEIAELIKSRKIPTKREILRCVMTLFDPLGTLAPYLIQGKMLVQDTWREGTLWDEQITGKLIPKWHKWLNTLGNIAEVRVPRCYYHQASGQKPISGVQQEVELHTFVDASELAYACVSYFRFMDDEKTIRVAQVMAKAKVAPVKILTIPRLELQGCVQGARMAKYVAEGHSYRVTQRYFWTDSSTALSWIHSDPKKYRPFVAHRVGEILELTDRREWYWVPSKQNPADEATRWGADLIKVDSTNFKGAEKILAKQILSETGETFTNNTTA